MNRIHRLICVGALAMALVGCEMPTTFSKDPAAQQQTLKMLPVAGEWSQPVDGVRCRLLLEQGRVIETNAVGAAFEIENVSSKPITLSSTGRPPFEGNALTWMIGQMPVVPEWMELAQETTTARMRLAPGQSYVTEMVKLLVPPGPGEQQVSAQLDAGGRLLKTAPVTLRVTPAAWGEPVKGIRARLSLGQDVYKVGQSLHARLFIHNLDHDPLVIHPPNWSTFDVAIKKQAVTMRVETADEQYAEVAKGWFWASAVPNSLLLAPGIYHFQLVLQSPELPIQFRRAWFGKLTTNEVTVEVVAE
ncbi:MAG TPA: hypothetical protein VHP11_03985 [Tepidisphaeraceae bacterium]|nr:hypothetical protein [Tepidisphaeraceae bacterium]